MRPSARQGRRGSSELDHGEDADRGVAGLLSAMEAPLNDKSWRTMGKYGPVNFRQ